MHKKLWLGVGAAVIAVGALAVGMWTAGNAFRLSIDGLGVTTEEYRYMMNARQYAVSTALEEQYGLQTGAGFWSAQVGDKAAYEVLAERTVDALKEHRALYGLAKERGYVEDISYGALLKRVENENRNRAEMQARGEPVYGLSVFTVDTFLTYEEDAIRTRYCDDAESPGMDIPEDAAHTKYEEMKDGYFHRSDSVSLTWLKIDYGALGLDRASLNGKLAALAAGSGPLYDPAAADTELVPYLEQKSLDYGDYRAASVEMPDILELADSLEAGKRTSVIDKNGVLYLIECTARTDGGYTPYEEARDYVLKTAREEAFDALVTRRAAESTVMCDMESIYRFTKKAVQ